MSKGFYDGVKPTPPEETDVTIILDKKPGESFSARLVAVREGVVVKQVGPIISWSLVKPD